MKKIRILIVFILFIVLFTTISYGNLEDIEKINVNDIKNEVSVETSKKIENEPNINSRIGLIYEIGRAHV